MVSQTGMSACSRCISGVMDSRSVILTMFFCRLPSKSKQKKDWIQEQLDNIYREALGVNDDAIVNACLTKKHNGKEHTVAKPGVGEARKVVKELVAGPKKAIGETSKRDEIFGKKKRR